MSKALELVRPDLHVCHASKIPFREFCHEKGISGYVFDLDNTIRHKEHGLDKAAIAAIRQGVKANYIKSLVILTNTIQGEERVAKARKLAFRVGEDIGLYVKAICLDYSKRKPKSDGFYLAIKEIGSSRSEIAMVGDQILSDIKGGNKVGLFTILVDPLGSYSWMSVISGRTIRNQWARWRLDL